MHGRGKKEDLIEIFLQIQKKVISLYGSTLGGVQSAKLATATPQDSTYGFTKLFFFCTAKESLKYKTDHQFP